MSEADNGHSRANRFVSRVATVASGVVLAAAGVYVVVYLARWEWNRAIVAATVFIAMMQVVSTAVIASRLRDLSTQARIVVVTATGGPGDGDGDGGVAEALGMAGVDPDVLTALRAAGDQRAGRHFEWLRADAGRVGVFVPVLLGTGMILSAVAWLVERFAGLVAGHSVDRATASAAPLRLPLGGAPQERAVIGSRPVGAPGPGPGLRRGRQPRQRSAAFLLAVLLVVAGIGVESVRRLTQSVPERSARPGVSVLEVAVRVRGDRPSADVAVALWGVCRERLDGLPHAELVGTSASQVTLQIDRALGATARRRLIGCMEDFTINGVLGTVVRLESVPTG